MLYANSFIRAGTAALALGLAPLAAAELVYVTSYDGTLTSVNLTLSSNSKTGQPEATLEQVAVNTGCAPQASWMTLDKPNSVLYCLNENFSGPNGSMTAYLTTTSGELEEVKSVSTPGGPVSAIIYGDVDRGIAVANFAGGAFSTYIKNPNSLALVQEEFFTLEKPGANATRQDASHPHQVIVDPTGDFFVVPDLGADLVRIFRIEGSNLTFTPVDPLVTPPGSGPRHASFVVASGKTYMYLTSELVNTVTGYEVTYTGSGDDSTLAFKEVFKSPTHGPGTVVPAAATAAEVVTSPDQRFVLVSTRSDNAFNISSFSAKNTTKLVSDSITTFEVDAATGSLSLVQLYASGGQIPRQFSINKAGTMLGVAEQGSARAVFINRDVDSGKLTGFAGAIDIAGQVTSVVFDE